MTSSCPSSAASCNAVIPPLSFTSTSALCISKPQNGLEPLGGLRLSWRDRKLLHQISTIPIRDVFFPRAQKSCSQHFARPIKVVLRWLQCNISCSYPNGPRWRHLHHRPHHVLIIIMQTLFTGFHQLQRLRVAHVRVEHCRHKTQSYERLHKSQNT